MLIQGGRTSSGTWRTVAEYLDRFDGQVAPNVAFLVGHGTVRMQVMGLQNRAPTAAELSGMLCRCTGYRNFLTAVAEVARTHPDSLPAP